MTTKYRIRYADGHSSTYDTREEADLHAAGAASLRAGSAQYAALPAYQVLGIDEITVSDAKTRTITLSDRPPVKIVEEEWPIIASAKYWDTQHESQANRTWSLRVRQHQQDGRTIVYGIRSTRFQGERGAAAGELLTPPEGAQIKDDEWYVWDEIPAAIKRVAARCGCERIADDCIADLPAVEI
jgi:hypothetical protein